MKANMRNTNLLCQCNKIVCYLRRKKIDNRFSGSFARRNFLQFFSCKFWHIKNTVARK